MKEFPPPQLKYKLAVVKLQKQQTNRISLWRTSLMTGLTMTLGFLSTLNYWQIKEQHQIKISGEKLVAENTIYRSLNFNYPQPIWQINGEQLVSNIEAIPAIETAKINRRIIPPEITISLQEKQPVAVASWQGKVGFLDAQGTWIPQEFYRHLNPEKRLPKLKVIDYQLQFQQQWSQIYQLISLYPELKTSEVHWQQSGNIFIQTKTGRFFLGSELSRLEPQFQIMSKLKNLPQHLDSSQIVYIDLSHSEVNLIQRY